MEKKELKKLLAGLSIAGLLTGGVFVSNTFAAEGQSG